MPRPTPDPVLRGIIIAVGSALLIAAGTAAWHMKENVSDHDADFLKLGAKLERVIDVLCDGKNPKPRSCDAPPAR